MASSRKIVIGLGVPKSGTHSLTRLLGRQTDTISLHEYLQFLPWEVDLTECYKRIAKLLCYSTNVVVDTSYFWLNYIDSLIETFGRQIKFICLERSKEDAMPSLLLTSTRLGRDSWIDDPKGRCFPYYNLSKEEAIEKYYDDYYTKAYEWQEKFPSNFIIAEMPKVFNDEELQRQVLKFVGFQTPTIKLGIHAQQSDKRMKAMTLEEREKEKYDKLWEHDIYNSNMGDCHIDEFFEEAGMESGDSLIDYGCGDGSAVQQFLDRGLNALGIDIVSKRLKEGIPFIEAPLWKLPSNTPITDYAFCCDVLEHVPPEKVRDSLDGIVLHTKEKAFLRICHRDDRNGPALIREPLHLTVRDEVWWEDRISKYFNIIKMNRLEDFSTSWYVETSG